MRGDVGTANRHARGWWPLSLALVVGGAAGAAVTFLGCGEELPLLANDPPPDATPAEGGAADTSHDGPTPSSCDLDPPTAPWILTGGDAQTQRLYRVAADEQGVILGGAFEGKVRFSADGPELTSAGKSDAFVVALTNDGKWRWGDRFGDANDQFITALSAQGDTVMAAFFFRGQIALPNANVLAPAAVAPDALLIRLSARDGTINT